MASEEVGGVGATVRSESSLLTVRGLTKAFAGVVALSSVDLDVGTGEVHALLGENGSGKSTLIKVLSGYHVPDEGTVLVDGKTLEFGSSSSTYNLGCRFIHQDLGLVGSVTVRDNLMFGAGFPRRFWTVRDRVAERESKELLQRVGLDVGPKQLVSELSAAQRTGVAMARALRTDPNVATKLLVLDEPTANLPDAEVQHLIHIVRNVARSGVGVIFVTHRVGEVTTLADSISVLRDGVKVATASTAGLSRRELVQMLVGSEFQELVRDDSDAQNSSPALLRVRRLRSGALRHIDIDAYPGEILGIAGITGSGRETLLSSVFGASQRMGGSVVVGGSEVATERPWDSVAAGIGFLPADRKTNGGVMQLTARENLTLADLKPLWKAPILRRKREYAECREWFERLNVKPSGAFDQTLERFSGGNQQKVLLGKWLRLKPRVLLLDEPTQGVDIGSKAEIHQLLVDIAQRGAAVVIASSDVDELATVCTRVVVLRGGRVACSLEGEELKANTISREAHGAEHERSTS